MSFVLVAIIIASVTTSMMCSISAYSVDGPYNIIEKQPSVQTVLLGQDLEFSNTDWTAPPIVNLYVSGYLETTYTATEKNGRYYIDTANWWTSRTFYVNGEPGGYEAQLSAEERYATETKSNGWGRVVTCTWYNAYCRRWWYKPE